MSLEKASISWSAKQLKGMVMNGKIKFDNVVQRSYVWERSRKSALIESMIIGYPIPFVYAKRIEDGSGKRGSNVYDIMDGKQRLSTVKEYLNDEFALTELVPVTYFDDEAAKECTLNISNKKFSELPEALQNFLSAVSFGVVYFDNLTKEEERELFKRLNAGKPLSTKSRLLASCQNIEGLIDIGSHSLFGEMLTDKARNNKNQVAIVMKCWCMMNQNIVDVSFESKVFNSLLEKTDISESEKDALIEVFDMIEDVHTILVDRKKKKVAKKLYTETHMVSLVPFFAKAIKSDIEAEMLSDWIVSFFDVKDNASVSEYYNEACTSGAAKNVNIVERNDALSDSYEDFFKADSNTSDDISDNSEEKSDDENQIEIFENMKEEIENDEKLEDGVPF